MSASAAGFFSAAIDVPFVAAPVPTPEQSRALDAIIAWWSDGAPGGVFKLGGYAGTGKTELTAMFVRWAGEEGLDVECVAPTGRAASVLTSKMRARGLDVKARTLFSLLYDPDEDEEGKLIGIKKGETADADLIVCDEASMVNEAQLSDLLELGAPVLLVGDHGQLPPYKGKPVIDCPDARLEQIHRQAAGNPIIALSRAVRETGQIDPALVDGETIRLLPASECVRSGAGVMSHALICRTNARRVQCNSRARSDLGFTAPGPQTGEILMCLRNIKRGGQSTGICNGMRALVEPGGVLYFPNEGIRAKLDLCPEQFGRQALSNAEIRERRTAGELFDFGYAMTVHKAQGSEFDHVELLLEPADHGFPDFRFWLYTAVTRASKRLTIWQA